MVKTLKMYVKKDKNKRTDCGKCQIGMEFLGTGIDRMGFVYYSSKRNIDKEKTIFTKEDGYEKNGRRGILRRDILCRW